MSSSGYSLWFVLASRRTNHITVCCVEPQALSLLSFSLSLSFFQVFICIIQVRERAWLKASTCAYNIDDLFHTRRIDPPGMEKVVYIVCAYTGYTWLLDSRKAWAANIAVEWLPCTSI